MPPQSEEPDEWISAVHDRLTKEHGPQQPQTGGSITQCLVGTVLSQHTSDVNSARAFAALEQSFDSWEDVAEAPVEQVRDAIRPGGLAETKAARIQRVLRTVRQREGRIDLSRLNSLADEEVNDYLCSLPGVGPKTAACVMAFAMGRHAFPVDTHVLRVARRLGWIAPKSSAEAAGRELTPRIPPAIRYSLHVALIDHGRRVCRSRRPRCSECLVLDLCDAGRPFVASGRAV
ncbi:endonuclease III [soil metagenome]